jgi:transposase
LTTKLHALVDGKGRPLVIHAGPGHAHDSPMLPVLLDDLVVPRLGPGRARTRPEALLADKAHSSRDHRALLRRRGIRAVIPEPANQVGHRRRRGRRGGRPVSYDRELYRHRNVIERGFNTFKQWRGLASRYDKLAITYRGGAVLRAITIWLA